MLPQILRDIRREALRSLFNRLKVACDPLPKFVVGFSCLAVDGGFRRFQHLFRLLPRLLEYLWPKLFLQAEFQLLFEFGRYLR